MYRVLTEQRRPRSSPCRASARPTAGPWTSTPIRAAAEAPTVVWLCSPNNPTAWPSRTAPSRRSSGAGRRRRRGRSPAADRRPRRGLRRVRRPLADRLRDGYPNLIVVRTASKAYALAGLRVGFAIARPEVIARLNPFRPPGSVSTVSVTVVTEALLDPDGLDANLARVERERDRLRDALPGVGWSVGPSVTNFLLVDFGSPSAAPSPRACSPARPRAAHLPGRASARRSPAPDRPRSRRERPARGRRGIAGEATTPLTTPLGDIEIGPREAGASTSPGRPRDRHHRHARPRRRGPPAIATGVGFYDHLLGSFAHHGLFDLAIDADGDLQVDEHHTVEDVALVLGSAFAEALGDRAGIRRFGEPRCRWTRRSPRPSSTSAAGRTPSSTCRSAASASAACRSSSSSTRSSRSPGPPGRPSTCADRPQRPSPGRGRVQGPRPRAARRLRARPAAGRRRLHQGRARMSAGPAAPRIAVVDYGAGNLVSIEQALTSVGAEVVARPTRGPARRRRPRGARGRRGRTGDGPPRGARADRADPGLDRRRSAVPRHLPRAAAPVRRQRRGRRPDPRRRCPAARSGWRRPDAPPHRLEPGRAGRGASAVRRHRRRGRLLLRPLVRRRPGRRPRTTTVLATTEHGGRSSPPSPAGRCSASSSTRSGAATTACACWPTSSNRGRRRPARPA